MKILVYEHACGGDFADGAVSPDILVEGLGMLRLCVAGLKVAGHEVTVIFGEELARFNPPVEADCVIPVYSFMDAQQAILKACASVDAVFVIAPEMGGVLHALVKLVEQTGIPTLNCYSSAIDAVSNKVNLYSVLENRRIRTPRTRQVDGVQGVRELIVGEFGFPVVVKPVDGVSCCGLSVVNEVSQIELAVEKVKEFSGESFVVQEFLRGEVVSVSLLCTGTQVFLVSLNKQVVNLSTPDGVSCYIGGAMPFNHEKKQEAFETAEAVVRCFSGLRGYVGVDLILTDDGPVVVDVNPRLTTSFIGLSYVTNFNFAEAIVNASLKNILPTEADFLGYTCFSKVETPNIDVDLLDLLYRIPEMISPPFPVPDVRDSCMLICAGNSNSLEKAQFLLEEAKKHLLNIMT
ncbi:MAG: ATP-grasp domain-containing protein [Nitrososphaerota archaeon]|nr:ATP-grasp domain-containing protein [Nitrososphaerota archaeon]